MIRVAPKGRPQMHVEGIAERPSDWSAVGYASDPVPGDPVVVCQGALDYQRMADSIASCAQALRSLDAGGSRGHRPPSLNGTAHAASRSSKRLSLPAVRWAPCVSWTPSEAILVRRWQATLKPFCRTNLRLQAMPLRYLPTWASVL